MAFSFIKQRNDPTLDPPRRPTSTRAEICCRTCLERGGFFESFSGKLSQQIRQHFLCLKKKYKYEGGGVHFLKIMPSIMDTSLALLVHGLHSHQCSHLFHILFLSCRTMFPSHLLLVIRFPDFGGTFQEGKNKSGKSFILNIQSRFKCFFMY